jgi:predicted nucleotidyltransferase
MNQRIEKMADFEKVLPSLIAWCRQRAVRLCVLFGSQATGQTHVHSDVDLAIWPAEALSTPARLRWITELEALLGQEISLVLVSADLDPVLGMEIVRHGRLIYEREPELWLHHRAQLWHAHNDSLPFLRAARQRLHEFAEEVRRGA